MTNQDVWLSPLDTGRYGITIARSDAVTIENFQSILEFCAQQDAKMLVARCSTADLPVLQMMEKQGFLLMDTLVYSEFNYAKSPIPDDIRNGFEMRHFRDGDEIIVDRIAREAFNDYFGHYHADPRLERAKSDDAYASWAVRACLSREVAEDVFIADVNGEVAGFFAVHMLSPQDGTGIISGVSMQHRGLGIYRSFMINAMKWVNQKGGQRMVVSTQINNIPVQKVWARLGFTMSKSHYTLHKWFDNETR